MKFSKVSYALASAGLVSLSFCATTALAQDAAPKVQKVEVIGSSIKRTQVETSASVQIMNREDIERTGATTALGVLTDSVAVNTSLNAASSSSGSFATGASAASMRGLGKVATLILVNGRRIAPYGLADGAQDNFTNLDAIAADAIERVEILKDGASAIYGSDAIAGVINIVLRKDYKGGQVKVGYRTAENFADNRSRNLHAIYGLGDLDRDGYNTYLTIEGNKRDGYSTGDLRNKYPDWHRLTPGRSTWDAKSAYSPTGNYFFSSTNIVAAPGCPIEDIDPVDKQCKFDTLPYSGLTTDSERYALASNTHFRIGNVDSNLELTYSNSYDSYILAPFSSSTGVSGLWYDVYGQKMVGPLTYPKLPVGHPNNPYTTPVEYRARLMDTGNGFNFNKTNTEQYRVMWALDGSYRGYDWKAAVGHMESSADKATRAVSAKGYVDAIVNKTYVFGKQNDRQLLESMYPIRTTRGKSATTFIDGTLTGELMQLPAGPLSFAVGADLRHEAYEMKSSDNVLRGELVGIFGLQVKDARNQAAIFTEATAPLTKKLELTAALRADKQGSFDAHVSPKLALKYAPSDSWLLRATAAGGFRAPNIVESGNGLGRSSVSNSVNDPRRCPIANDLNNLVQSNPKATTSDKSLANSYRNSDCSGSLPSFVASNPNLQPETSRSYTLGLVFAPSKTWSFAIDYFNIERKDEIGNRSVVDILKGEASLPAGQLLRVDNSATDNQFLDLVKKYAPTNTINFQNIGKLGLVFNPYVNTGKTRASGFDFDLRSRFKIENVGDLTLNLEGNYEWNYQTFSEASNTWNKNLSGTYDRGGQLETKVIAALKTGVWSNSVVVSYNSGYSSNSLSSPTYCVTQKVPEEHMATCARIDPSTRVNYSLTYSGIKNTRLNLYVGNVFQAEQPIDWRGGWSSSFRTYYINASYQF